jgi:hypothetical protein
MCDIVQQNKSVAFLAAPPYKVHMSDIISNDAAHDPLWKELCLAAVAELNPAKLPERIAAARRAVLNRIEDRYSKPSDGEEGEELVLRDALVALRSLRMIAERETSD